MSAKQQAIIDALNKANDFNVATLDALHKKYQDQEVIISDLLDILMMVEEKTAIPKLSTLYQDITKAIEKATHAT